MAALHAASSCMARVSPIPSRTLQVGLGGRAGLRPGALAFSRRPAAEAEPAPAVAHGAPDIRVAEPIPPHDQPHHRIRDRFLEARLDAGAIEWPIHGDAPSVAAASETVTAGGSLKVR